MAELIVAVAASAAVGPGKERVHRGRRDGRRLRDLAQDRHEAGAAGLAAEHEVGADDRGRRPGPAAGLGARPADAVDGRRTGARTARGRARGLDWVRASRPGRRIGGRGRARRRRDGPEAAGRAAAGGDDRDDASIATRRMRWLAFIGWASCGERYRSPQHRRSPIAVASPPGNDPVTGRRSSIAQAAAVAVASRGARRRAARRAPRRSPARGRCSRRGATDRPCRSARRCGRADRAGRRGRDRRPRSTTPSARRRRARPRPARPARARGRCRAGCRGSARAAAGPSR